MEFFKTDDGRLHGNRIAGVLYIIGFLPGCIWGAIGPMCIMRLTFVAGWWLSFCDKRPVHRGAELRQGRRLIGIIVVLIGLIGSFYFIGHN
jgi:hypothetical protein